MEPSSSKTNSQPLTGEQIRNAFLNFYADRGHKMIESASLVPEDPTVLLTIAGMLPFKPVFLGHQDRPAKRVVTSQKCIRTNDIENVGRTARHQTFFEMLGNFSFGDYFKKEAIQWAWELSTDVFGLDPNNLVVSVFREDDEAEEIWRDIVGVNPNRIIRMDEADNFWSSGPTGPCGPCSELYYDFMPHLGSKNIDLEDDTRFIEFYNLVFMQYNRDSNGTITSLANCNIDTGMGLERMAQILQKVPNNYETDLMYPLIVKVANLAKIDYTKVDVRTQISFKVIADHIRACVQLIGDGVTATNLGRGYVLRRLLRRVIRHGRLIGIQEPFLIKIGQLAIDLMQSPYPSLIERSHFILNELAREESRFLETLERGQKLLDELLLANPKMIKGDEAFELYDTYGFPIELTQEIANEHQIEVDIDGFEEAMERQRQRAKAANNSIDLTVQDSIEKIVRNIKPTQFIGYEGVKGKSVVKGIVLDGNLVEQANAGDSIQVILDSTPFYGEAGGQIGDIGILTKDSSSDCLVDITNVIRSNNVFVHYGLVKQGSLKSGDLIHSEVGIFDRRRAQINHTSTHLLQAALRKVVDSGISQAGSLVDFHRLRFDFHYSSSLSSEQIERIEKLINSWILEAHPLLTEEMNINAAKKAGALAMFGEKYGEKVRVVNVPGVSMELCGGTHVKNTSEIGLFKIITESGIAAGIRRIEAIAGNGALDYFNDRDKVVRSLSERFKAQPHEIVDRVVALQDEVKNLTNTLIRSQEEIAQVKASALLTKALAINNSQILVERIDGIASEALHASAKSLVDQLGQNSVVVLAGTPIKSDSTKVVFVAVFGLDVVDYGLHAGKFLGPIAKLCGGGGGGRANFAQAGGRDSKNLNVALQSAKDQLITSLESN